MGKNKIKIEKIENEKIRMVTYYKRRKGLIKKAMEIAVLCDMKVFLCIVNQKNKISAYSSETDMKKFKEMHLDNILKTKIIMLNKVIIDLFKG
jgi:hypothetical protein